MSTQTTHVSGVSVVAGRDVRGGGGTFRAVAAATGEPLEPAFGQPTLEELRVATDAAADAFAVYRATTPTERAAFLEAVAEEIEGEADVIVPRAVLESGLPEVRLRGELGARRASSGSSPSSLVRATISGPGSTPPCRSASPCRAQTCASGWCHSGLSPSSAPATSRWRSPRPAVTRHPPWPPGALSSSRVMPPTRARVSSRPER